MSLKKSNFCRLVGQSVPGGLKNYSEIVGHAKALILSLETVDEHIYESDTNTITRYKK